MKMAGYNHDDSRMIEMDLGNLRWVKPQPNGGVKLESSFTLLRLSKPEVDRLRTELAIITPANDNEETPK